MKYNIQIIKHLISFDLVKWQFNRFLFHKIFEYKYLYQLNLNAKYNYISINNAIFISK